MTRAAAIAAWLPRARWFADKGVTVTGVSIHAAAPIPGTPVTLALVDVAADGGHGRYVVPLVDDADAALSPEFAGWLVGAVRAGAVLATDGGVFRSHALTTPGDHSLLMRGMTTVASLGGDASNTSLLVTDGQRQFAVKLLRRCREGIQPEVEVGAFLSRDAGWAGTPRLRGWLDFTPAAGEPITLATLHDFVPGCTSAWDHLGRLVRAGGLTGPDRGAILGAVSTLGHLTADMHRALASRSDIPAFAPVLPTAADMQAEAGRMADHANTVLDRAAARIDGLPAAVAAGLHRLLERRHEIVINLRGVATIESSATLIRVHGDYHLGQVLVRAPGPEALVIDFEGEPGRSLADRRRKTTVFKDIAGMCRSFDYLLRHAAHGGGSTYRADDFRLLEQTFLDAYRGVARGQAWWPADAAVADTLLDIYTLDKAVYELAYELANRPDWVEVPLAALMERQACRIRQSGNSVAT